MTSTTAATGSPDARDSTEAHETERTEQRLDDVLERIVEEGRPRLHRTWSDMLATGFVGGAEVSIGVLALLIVITDTGNQLLGGLAFSFGFIALLLGHSELFTEGFLVPVTVVVSREARWSRLARFWAGILVGNLAGGLVVMWLAMAAYPEVHQTAITGGSHFVDMGIGWRSFALAVLAGSAITIMTRMHNGTDSVPAKLVASVVTAFVLAGLRLAHSILDSLLIFAALFTGHSPFGVLDWAGWFAWTVFGNMVGGIGLVTLLRLVRSKEAIKERRQATRDTSSGSTANG